MWLPRRPQFKVPAQIRHPFKQPTPTVLSAHGGENKVNSEELELSLRAEFESYLSGVLAEMKQEVAEFKKKVEDDLDKQRSQIGEAFQGFSAKFDAERAFDKSFSESVVEHLRLARDDGAKVAATAYAEAEKFGRDGEMPAAAPVPPSYDSIRDAINDISSKTSQSSLLKALTDHCSKFAPRGAFFIIRNDSFVGWRVMNATGSEDMSTDVRVPTSSNTLLREAADSLAMATGSFGSHADDKEFLDALGFGQPDNMVAVPLVARGRGVAVLYADGAEVNKEAVETLVRVASLTVELLASSQAAKPQAESEKPEEAAPASEPAPQAEANEPEPAQAAASFEPAEEVHEPEFEAETEHEVVAEESPAVEFESSSGATLAAEEPAVYEPEVTEIEVERAAGETETVSAEAADEQAETAEAAAPVAEEVPAVQNNGNGHVETAETAHAPARPTRSLRYVDLPIEVAEEERNLHYEARRFARLLVSEIKLYNEAQVKQGREASDLYDRLREAVDRSREMYEKRVKPPVAAKFDYFHYELVNGLAEGDEARLGGS
jgi:hypothetical protein